LGPLAFATMLQPIVTKFQAQILVMGLKAWYMDDCTLIGCSEDLAATLVIEKRKEVP